MAPRATDPTPQRLLDAALAIFAEKGFAGARVDEIARRARANKAMIYYHFGDKRELYQRTLLRAFAPLRDALRPLGEAEPDARRRLVTIAAAVSRLLTEQPALARMMLREMLAGGRHLTPATSRSLTEVFGLVRRTLEQGVAQRAFRPTHPLLTHLLLIGAVVFFHATPEFRERVLPHGAPDLKPPGAPEFLEHLQEFLLRGLGRGKN